MINYENEIKKYANDRDIKVSNIDIFKFTLSFALFCKDCERCIILTLYRDIREPISNYRSDDNLRYIYIVMCDDCTVYISDGGDWKIDTYALSKSKIYIFTTKLTKAKFFDKDGNPILKISSAVRSDSVYDHIMRVKCSMYLYGHITREVSNEEDPTIVDSDAHGFF